MRLFSTIWCLAPLLTGLHSRHNGCQISKSTFSQTAETKHPTYKSRIPEKDYATHRLLIGTHTSNEAQNYLQIAHVQLPKPVTPDAADYDDDREEIGGYGGGASKKSPVIEVKFNITQKIDHPGEVNKARYQPQNPNVIATMCVDGRVMIWDRTKHASQPTGNINPQMELLGHEAEGFGLSWSPHQAGHLATGSEDQTVRIWWVRTKNERLRIAHFIGI